MNETLIEALMEFDMVAEAESFGCNEIALFHVLVMTWNKSRRPNIIKQHAEATLSKLGRGISLDTLARTRNKLVQAKVIDFYKSGNRGIPHYSIEPLFGHESSLLGLVRSKARVKPELCQSKARVKPELCQSKARVKPELCQTLNRGEKEERREEIPLSDSEESNESLDSFLNQIWKLFAKVPRNRSSKKDLKKAWQSLKSKPDREEMLTNIKAWSVTPEWNELDGQYIAGVHRWIKSEKWRGVPEIESLKAESSQKQTGAVQVGGRKGYIHSASDLKISTESNEDEKNMF